MRPTRHLDGETAGAATTPTPFERDLGAVIQSFTRSSRRALAGSSACLRRCEWLFLVMGPAGIVLGVVDLSWWHDSAGVPALTAGALMTWVASRCLARRRDDEGRS